MTNFLAFMKNVGLFFASPFIALGYVVALPFVGMWYILNFGIEAAFKKATEQPIDETTSIKV